MTLPYTFEVDVIAGRVEIDCIPTFPARIQGSAGIHADAAGGVATVRLDYLNLQYNSPMPVGAVVAYYNPATGLYESGPVLGQGDADARYILKAGDTMAGPLLLVGTPTAVQEATPKKYVDDSVSAAVVSANTYTDSTVSAVATAKVSKSGDTMTGPLSLSSDPTTALQAATKQYVDAGTSAANTNANNRVARAGDTMTGLLTLSGAPTANLHAASKKYVDDGDTATLNTAKAYADGKLSLTGGTLSGPLTLSGDPTTNLQAATKQYIDNKFLPLSGGVMSGYIVAHADPVNPYQVATKNYVDGKVGVPADGSITNAKLANMAQSRIKGRVSSGTGVPEDLTGAQVAGLLPVVRYDGAQGLNTTQQQQARDNIATIARMGDTQQMVLNNASSTFGRFAVKNATDGVYAAEGLSIIKADASAVWTMIFDTSLNLFFGFNGTSKANINYSTGAYTAISDRRLKDNITDLPSCTTKVKSLRPVSYNMKSDSAHKKLFGFIAQEVETVLPEVVTPPGASDAAQYYMLDTNALVPVLTKALQEALARIEALEARLP